MEARRIGSIVVVDEAHRPSGIFTRQDVIGRVVLPQLALDTPVGSVASHPVVTLSREATAGDAAVEMARHGVRHIVVVDATGRVDGVVSERDLFALQRLSVRELASELRRAADVPALAACAANIRDLAHSLVAQGLSSAQLTRTISSLNDQLLHRLIAITLPAHALAGVTFCWLGMGSEGRNEQTIATDQDNGIVFDAAAPGDVEPLRARLLPFARAINEALDACGYPLCKGGVMAMNPRWCSSLAEWRDAFRTWIERGDPQSLLDAQIFFDFRSLFGESRLAHALRDDIARRARATPRFLKQMSDNALTREPPLNWFGELSGAEIDLKLQGTTLFVDGARILALASGVTATSTAERFEGAGEALGVAARDTRAWVESFEYLQLLRLRTQHRRATGAIAAAGNANVVPLADLSELDRRIVKEAMRQARLLQQRLALDYPG
jgi:CBS domain-containing protein